MISIPAQLFEELIAGILTRSLVGQHMVFEPGQVEPTARFKSASERGTTDGERGKHTWDEGDELSKLAAAAEDTAAEEPVEAAMLALAGAGGAARDFGVLCAAGGLRFRVGAGVRASVGLAPEGSGDSDARKDGEDDRVLHFDVGWLVGWVVLWGSDVRV